MEIKKLVRIISKRLWFILLLVLIGALATYCYSTYVLEPIYESDVKLYVMCEDESEVLDYDDILVSYQLMQNYIEIIKSRTFMQDVINKVNLNDASQEKFLKNVHVKIINETNIMDITVVHNDPLIAQKLAKTISDALIERVKTLSNNFTIAYVDEANVPNSPSFPNIKIFVGLSSALSLIIGVFITILTDIFYDTIKTVEEVEQRYGMEVIGTLPKF